MGRSIIPPRTMRQLAQQRRRYQGLCRVAIQLRLGRGSASGTRSLAPTRDETDYPTGLFQKPRNWRFQTKPLFKKVQGPLVDVFEEAEEVLIVIDLSGFRRGDVSINLTPEKYVILARRGAETFREEIRLPPEVDLDQCAEQFRNGVLEIILPRKKGVTRSEGEAC